MCVEFNPVSVIIRETVTVRQGGGEIRVSASTHVGASWRSQPAAPTKTL